jgi:hypothetical protein
MYIAAAVYVVARPRCLTQNHGLWKTSPLGMEKGRFCLTRSTNLQKSGQLSPSLSEVI